MGTVLVIEQHLAAGLDVAAKDVPDAGHVLGADHGADVGHAAGCHHHHVRRLGQHVVRLGELVEAQLHAELHDPGGEPMGDTHELSQPAGLAGQ